jgi:hypothetical protein
MAYFIPRGTPIEIQRGGRVHANITSCDFCFLEPVLERPNEMVFTDGKSYFLVAKALVIGDYIDARPNASEALECVRPASADQVGSF